MEHRKLTAAKRRRVRKFLERKHKKRVVWTGTKTVTPPKVPRKPTVLPDEEMAAVVEEIYRRTLFQHETNQNQWRICLQCWLFFRVFFRVQVQDKEVDRDTVSAWELRQVRNVTSVTALLEFIKDRERGNGKKEGEIRTPGIRHEGLSPKCEHCADFSTKKKKAKA